MGIKYLPVQCFAQNIIAICTMGCSQVKEQRPSQEAYLSVLDSTDPVKQYSKSEMSGLMVTAVSANVMSDKKYERAKGTVYDAIIREARKCNPEACTQVLKQLFAVAQDDPKGKKSNSKEEVGTESEDSANMKAVKSFLYLYTCPVILQNVHQSLGQNRFDNYTKLVAYAMNAIKQMSKKDKESIALPQTTGFSLWATDSKMLQYSKDDISYWTTFKCCSLKKILQFELSSDKTLIEIQFKPPVKHIYLKVPENSAFSRSDGTSVILFPFFQFRVLECSSIGVSGKNKLSVRELKEVGTATARKEDTARGQNT